MQKHWSSLLVAVLHGTAGSWHRATSAASSTGYRLDYRPVPGIPSLLILLVLSQFYQGKTWLVHGRADPMFSWMGHSRCARMTLTMRERSSSGRRATWE